MNGIMKLCKFRRMYKFANEKHIKCFRINHQHVKYSHIEHFCGFIYIQWGRKVGPNYIRTNISNILQTFRAILIHFSNIITKFNSQANIFFYIKTIYST